MNSFSKMTKLTATTRSAIEQGDGELSLAGGPHRVEHVDAHADVEAEKARDRGEADDRQEEGGDGTSRSPSRNGAWPSTRRNSGLQRDDGAAEHDQAADIEREIAGLRAEPSHVMPFCSEP